MCRIATEWTFSLGTSTRREKLDTNHSQLFCRNGPIFAHFLWRWLGGIWYFRDLTNDSPIDYSPVWELTSLYPQGCLERSVSAHRWCEAKGCIWGIPGGVMGARWSQDCSCHATKHLHCFAFPLPGGAAQGEGWERPNNPVNCGTVRKRQSKLQKGHWVLGCFQLTWGQSEVYVAVNYMVYAPYRFTGLYILQFQLFLPSWKLWI